MLEAFRELDHDVRVVDGTAAQRRRAIASVDAELRKGTRFAFTYGESSTMPTALTEPHHLPVRPFMDFAFFRRLRGGGTPVGLFYRDVHWRFEEYRQRVPWHKRAAAVTFYHQEWQLYRRTLDHLFLPSLCMAATLPSAWPEQRLSALPPGCELSEQPGLTHHSYSGKLRLLYVGGVTPPHYDLRPMVDIVQRTDGVALTLCCRAEEWALASSYYATVLGDCVEVVHAKGNSLNAHYAAADVFLLYWRPDEYLDFAMPVKVLEAIGNRLPVITTAGTEAARFVEQEGVGWIVATDAELRSLLSRLRTDRRPLAEKRAALMASRERNSWQARARCVAATLTRYRGSS
jgi:glycosyltransferase involved in cell wall biosynthesis